MKERASFCAFLFFLEEFLCGFFPFFFGFLFISEVRIWMIFLINFGEDMFAQDNFDGRGSSLNGVLQFVVGEENEFIFEMNLI